MHHLRSLTLFCAALALALMLPACGKTDSASNSGDAAGESSSHGHSHDAAAAHDDHAHDDHADDDHAHDAEPRPLGAITIAGVTLDVTITGDLAPGAELHFEAARTSRPAPAALRVWIGAESAAGSTKIKADAHDDHYHAHLPAPAQITPETTLWLEIQSASGERTAASMPLR